MAAWRPEKSCVFAATVLDPSDTQRQTRTGRPFSCLYRTRPAAFCPYPGGLNFGQIGSASPTLHRRFSRWEMGSEREGLLLARLSSSATTIPLPGIRSFGCTCMLPGPSSSLRPPSVARTDIAVSSCDGRFPKVICFLLIGLLLGHRSSSVQ